MPCKIDSKIEELMDEIDCRYLSHLKFSGKKMKVFDNSLMSRLAQCIFRFHGGRLTKKQSEFSIASSNDAVGFLNKF